MLDNGLPYNPEVQIVHVDPRVPLPQQVEKNEETCAPGSLNFIRAADVELESVNWLWSGRLARGKITLIAGDPGKGKSQISLDVAARISTGSEWPDGGYATQGSVLILSAEDAANDTIVPRLVAAGGNLHRVHILKSVNEGKARQRSFCLDSDLTALGHKVEAVGDVALVIIDPITSYMGNIDSHRTTDVRAVLEPVAAWAERHDVAVLAISHPPKAPQSKAINSVTGSLAFVAAARLVFLVTPEPETERLLLLPVKSNIGPGAAGMGYQIVAQEIARGIATSRIEWDNQPVKVTADDAIRAWQTEKSKAINAAEDFLQNFLGLEARPAKEVEAAASEAGIAYRTLMRAKRNLKIVSEKDDFGGGWTWKLP